jgi:hypothetical protein
MYFHISVAFARFPWSGIKTYFSLVNSLMLLLLSSPDTHGVTPSRGVGSISVVSRPLVNWVLGLVRLVESEVVSVVSRPLVELAVVSVVSRPLVSLVESAVVIVESRPLVESEVLSVVFTPSGGVSGS